MSFLFCFIDGCLYISGYYCFLGFDFVNGKCVVLINYVMIYVEV